MLLVVKSTIASSDRPLPSVRICVERSTLAKRLWRGIADDGVEFGFELDTPLKHGDLVHESSLARYVIDQQLEALVEISLDIAPSAAAGIGWAIGNLHLELSSEPTRLLALDEPAVRQLLDRLKVPYTATSGVFRPGRFARGTQMNHELGASHKH